jgi:hypothetical protein
MRWRRGQQVQGQSESAAETSEPEGNVVDAEFTEDNATPQAAAVGADEEPPLCNALLEGLLCARRV